MSLTWGIDESYVRVLKNAVTVILCVLVFVVPVQAVALGGTGSFDIDGDGPAANLDCLDEDRGEISDQLGRLAGRTMDILPESVQNRVVGEKLSIIVGGSSYFAATVSETGTIERVRTGQAENPTVIVRTECQTVADIESAASPTAALERSISRGDVRLRGTSTTSDAAASYGGKGIQAYHITQSSETGNVQDGTDGFTSGLVYD
jgi:hypothetical protein